MCELVKDFRCEHALLHLVVLLVLVFVECLSSYEVLLLRVALFVLGRLGRGGCCLKAGYSSLLFDSRGKWPKPCG